MIQLPHTQLPADTSRQLYQYHEDVISIDIADYANRVGFVKKRFGQVNTPKNRTFKKIREVLLSMTSGADRCHYCEDSKADEVEHFAPKNWYPEKCFVWENYCIACGPCNGPKNDSFPIFKDEDGILYTPERKKDDPVLPPPSGRYVLIDPRVENPLDFLFLDIENQTFTFTELGEEGSEAHIRAQMTIDILGLNKRAYLCKARKNAFGNYKARLSEYLIEKNNYPTSEKLAAMVEGIKSESHPTVWAEMKRQARHIDEIRTMFEAIQPEIEAGVF